MESVNWLKNHQIVDYNMYYIYKSSEILFKTYM